jgi:hypothetical protein
VSFLFRSAKKIVRLIYIGPGCARIGTHERPGRLRAEVRQMCIRSLPASLGSAWLMELQLSPLTDPAVAAITPSLVTLRPGARRGLTPALTLVAN